MNAPAHTPWATSSATVLTRRVTDNLFRRLVLYMLPLVLFAAIGIQTAATLPTVYQSDAGLSASANPFVGGAQTRGAAIADWETAASGTARLINEQLQTDVFTREVAERAELTAQVESGTITLDTIRGQVQATPAGSSSLNLVARWDDPVLAQRLVESTLAAYLERSAEVAASDSNDAIDFWTDRLAEADLRVEQAEAALEGYLRTLLPLPEGQPRGAEEQLTIARLQGELERAIQSANTAQGSIDSARLNLVQAQSEAGRQLRVVDPPTVPSSPESNRAKALLTVVMFTGLGLLVSLTALIATTLLDRTVRIDHQVSAITGTPTATISDIRSGAPGRRGRTPRTLRRAAAVPPAPPPASPADDDAGEGAARQPAPAASATAAASKGVER